MRRTATGRQGERRLFTLGVGLALAGAGWPSAGCDTGYAMVLPGVVHDDAICAPSPTAPTPGACPPCSTRVAGGSDGDRGRCADRYYAAAFRCDDANPCAGGACAEGYCVATDLDGNGLDDTFQGEVARRNLPALGFHPDERCGEPRGVVASVRRHPLDARRLAIAYVVLYANDCGPLNGHLGDDEGFAITVDLDAAPGPAATVGVITVAHRDTACQSITTCETAPGTSACALEDLGQVLIFSSKDKHANYLDPAVCDENCLDACQLGSMEVAARLADVGRPGAPLTRDLTDGNGLILAADGWPAELLHFDPWSPEKFAGAGHVGDQLTDIVAPPGLSLPTEGVTSIAHAL